GSAPARRPQMADRPYVGEHADRHGDRLDPGDRRRLRRHVPGQHEKYGPPSPIFGEAWPHARSPPRPPGRSNARRLRANSANWHMSEPLVITIPHKLGKQEALRRIKPALGNASQSFPVLKVDEEVWTDDRMDFRVRALGQTAAGNVQVADDSVRIEAT